ncbi:MAG: SUMF1/EgtB/PvdO family nonheme iron enzyme [Rubrivivax sp.]|nr:SUMF1/EgtB/PvdO family nonheme iron enzyme [Rubrivivax sp.]
MQRLLLLLLFTTAAQAETYVVAAGVQEYQDENIPGLRYAAADATAIGEAFVTGGVPPANVTVLTSPATEERLRATKINVFKALDRAVERARANDTIVFFFAGHGLERGGVSYLLPADTYNLTLADTAMALTALNQILEPALAGQVLFIIDACRNDPTSARGDQDAKLTDGLARGLRPLFTGTPGQASRGALLLACDVGQRAYEMPSEQHGGFTYWLLRGFQQAAGPDGTVRLGAVAEYVQREVPEWAKTRRWEQTPRFDNPANLDFVLLRRPIQPPAQPPVQPPTPPATPGNTRPANWPEYLRNFTPPQGMTWASFKVSPKDLMPQVLIPAGEFLMGSPAGEGDDDEHPQQRVYVSAFWMDVHEVTVEQYRRFCQATGRQMDTDLNAAATHPVVMVSWEDATAYATWAGRELPTEAQWEKAARGGTTTAYPWGDAWNEALANSHGTGTKPVGSYAPNRFGLFDMIGNVWEWCRDAYEEDWYRRMPVRDPFNAGKADSPRVLRGGSWLYSPDYLRVAYRTISTPDYRNLNFGFRCSEAP